MPPDKKPEAFVYLWRDSNNNKFYLGYHKGTPDDNYAHSSTAMESFNMSSIPEGFSRRILAQGTNDEMMELEKKLLTGRKERGSWEKYYNIATSTFPYMWDDPEHRKKMSDGTKAQWEDPEFRNLMSDLWEDPAYREKMSDGLKALWGDPEFRAMNIERNKAQWEDPTHRKKVSDSIKAQWKDPEFRAMYAKKMSDLWGDPEYRRKQRATCSVCGLESRKSAITRYHNERCKHTTP